MDQTRSRRGSGLLHATVAAGRPASCLDKRSRSTLVSRQRFSETLELAPAGTIGFEIPDAAHHVLVDQPIALAAALNALFTAWPVSLGAASELSELEGIPKSAI